VCTGVRVHWYTMSRQTGTEERAAGPERRVWRVCTGVRVHWYTMCRQSGTEERVARSGRRMR